MTLEYLRNSRRNDFRISEKAPMVRQIVCISPALTGTTGAVALSVSTDAGREFVSDSGLRYIVQPAGVLSVTCMQKHTFPCTEKCVCDCVYVHRRFSLPHPLSYGKGISI